MTNQNVFASEAILKGEADLKDSIESLSQFEEKIQPKESPTEALKSCILKSKSPFSPWIYLAYYRLGNWLISGNANQQNSILNLITEVDEAISNNNGTIKKTGEVCAYGDNAIASSGLWQSALSLFQEGGDFIEDLERPEDSLLLHWQQKVDIAHQLIRAVDPDLMHLMNQLQRLVILAKPGPKSVAINESFGGATCFFFRGASVINAARPQSTIEIMEKIVHEYAHAELFVLGQDQPLCLNTDDDRHKVLIRKDPRPMNGILHALYVTGRVAEVMNRLLSHDLGELADKKNLLIEANSMLNEQISLGHSSLEQVHKHAKLTTIGDIIVQASASRLANAQKA